MSSRKRQPRHLGPSSERGIAPAKAALLFLVVASVLGYLGVTKTNPFADPYQLDAVFQRAHDIKAGAPVRVAGVDVGKVTHVEPLRNGTARVQLTLEDRALPIHADAKLKMRPRLFPEGNYFVELHSGSPSARSLPDRSTIPLTQTSASVPMGDVLSALQTDTRSDLQLMLRELAAAFDEEAAEGLQDYIPLMEPAYRNGSLSSEASLGEDPDRDVQRALQGTQQTAAGFAADERALRGFVANLSATVGALAEEDAALEAAVPALRDTLRAGAPALDALNDALPPLRDFAQDALPGVRRTAPALEASLPALREARLLMRPDELRGVARLLRSRMPSLVALVRTAVPVFEQGRAASRCTARVLVPFSETDFPDPDFPANTGTVGQQTLRALVGNGGEGRNFDANGTYSHVSVVPYAAATMRVRPAPPPRPDLPPRHRPDVPCETQEPPDLDAPAAIAPPGSNGGEGLLPLSADVAVVQGPLSDASRQALLGASALIERHFDRIALKQLRLLRKGGWR